MNEKSVRVEIARGVHSSTVRSGLSVDDAGDIIRGLEGEPDVTVTVSWAGVTNERVMLAISGANVFVGLVQPIDELYQYVAHGHDNLQGEIPFVIGGQRAPVRSRYVVDVKTAADVLQEWLSAGYESSSIGRWEHA